MRTLSFYRQAAGACALVGLVGASTGCPEDKPSRVDELVSAAQEKTSDPVPAPREAPTWETMPSITVDDLGAYIGGRRASELDKPAGKKKLDEICSALPIKGETVTIVALKKSKVLDVVETVWALGKVGAPNVIIKTDAREDLAKEIKVTPQNRIDGADDCSAVAMVTSNADTGVWPFGGGGGKRHRKGFAGPDLSNTEESVKKILKSCDSKTAFFTAAYNMPWEHAYSMGAIIVRADEDKQIDKLVLLGDEPVAGRKVELRK